MLIAAVFGALAAVLLLQQIGKGVGGAFHAVRMSKYRKPEKES